MRICKDCKAHDDGICAKSRDLVTGKPLDARAVRNEPDLCGKGGKWFEPINEDWREPRDEDGYRKPE